MIIFVSFIGGVFGFQFFFTRRRRGLTSGYQIDGFYLLGDSHTALPIRARLFEIIISASYGTFSHAIKGNVDILIALVMNTGAAIGAQIGAICTQYFTGPKIRLAFVPLPLIGAVIVIYTLWSGHKL